MSTSTPASPSSAGLVLVESIQVVAPVADEYLPASQSMQVVAPVADEYLPSSQSVQVVAPVADEYVPAAQSRQPQLTKQLVSPTAPVHPPLP